MDALILSDCGQCPATGTAFGALAASPSSSRLSLPDGLAVVDGVVVERRDTAGQGIAVQFDHVDDIMRIRLSAASAAPRGEGDREASPPQPRWRDGQTVTQS
jgi:hypothetical protein